MRCVKAPAFVLLALLASVPVRAVEAPLDLAQSYLKFTGHAFLHDFNGEAKKFSGTAQVDVAQPNLVTSAQVTVQVPLMTTFDDARDHNMLMWLHADTHPSLGFQLASVKLDQGDVAHPTKDQPAQFTVAGSFTLNGMTHPLKVPATAWREGKLLVVAGAFKLNTGDYGLPQVKQLFLTVDEQVDVSYRLAFDLQR